MRRLAQRAMAGFSKVLPILECKFAVHASEGIGSQSFPLGLHRS